tara:strand:- start:266 stop:733 length:468 start_codon:yes stop_codon:yes gene_type:complete
MIAVDINDSLRERKENEKMAKKLKSTVKAAPVARQDTRTDAVSRETYNRQMASFDVMPKTLVKSGMDPEAAEALVANLRADYTKHHRIKRTKGGHIETLKFASDEWNMTLAEIQTLIDTLQADPAFAEFELVNARGVPGTPELKLIVEVQTSENE